MTAQSRNPSFEELPFVLVRPMSWAMPRYAAAREMPISELESFWEELGLSATQYRGVGRPSLRAVPLNEDLEVAGWGRQIEGRFGLLADYRDATTDDEELEARLLLRSLCTEQGSVLPSGGAALQAVRKALQSAEWEALSVSSSELRAPNTLGFDLGWSPEEIDSPFYSILSDSAILPLWHGPPDDELHGLKDQLRALNVHQLFATFGAAVEFRDWYESTDWGEESDSGFDIWRIDAPVTTDETRRSP